MACHVYSYMRGNRVIGYSLMVLDPFNHLLTLANNHVQSTSNFIMSQYVSVCLSFTRTSDRTNKDSKSFISKSRFDGHFFRVFTITPISQITVSWFYFVAFCHVRSIDSYIAGFAWDFMTAHHQLPPRDLWGWKVESAKYLSK